MDDYTKCEDNIIFVDIASPKYFTREEDITSINYFEKIYGSYKVIDFNSYYKNALQEIRKIK